VSDVVQANSSQRSGHCGSGDSKGNVDQSNKSAWQHSLDKGRVDKRGRGIVEGTFANHLACSIIASNRDVTALVCCHGGLGLV